MLRLVLSSQSTVVELSYRGRPSSSTWEKYLRNCKRKQRWQWPFHSGIWNLYLINNVEDIVVFLIWKVFLIIPICYPAVSKYKSHFWREPTQLKLISFLNYKHWYLTHTWSDKPFQVTVVNLPLPSLHRGSLEITLTLPFTSYTKSYHLIDLSLFYALTFPLYRL